MGIFCFCFFFSYQDFNGEEGNCGGWGAVGLFSME